MTDRIARFVEAQDGTRIAWHTHARGTSPDALAARRAVVLTNGLSTTSNFWRALVSELSRDHRVVHWDYRGHGASEGARSGDYRIATHADDLARVTEAVRAAGRNPAPALHVAFSMGVTVLLELVRDRPELVGAMTLIAGGADHPHASAPLFRVPGVLPAVRAATKALSPIVERSSPLTRRLTTSRAMFPIARAFGAVGAHAPREEVEHFARAVGAMDLRAYWRSAVSLLNAHSSDVLGSVTVPALVVAPEFDLLASRRDLEALARAIPGAEYAYFPDTTHAMLLEAGPAIARRVRTFVEKVG